MVDLPNDSPAERKRLGRALAMLRNDAGLTQPQAAEAMGITLQAYQNYEYGKRIFTPDLVRAVTGALTRKPEDLLAMRQRVNIDEVQIRPPSQDLRRSPYELPLIGHVRAGPQGLHVYDPGDAPETLNLSHLFGPDIRVLKVAGESMLRYADPGSFAAFNVRGVPRRDEGCVIQLTNGDYFVKIYNEIRGGVLMVTELYPEERQLSFDLGEVAGVYPVEARLR